MRSKAATCPNGQGFTLIEMMIALAVAGLIFFLALPGYRHILLKSHRVIGKAVLLDVLTRQEQYLVNHHRYAPDLASLGLPDPYRVDSQAQHSPAKRAIYRIELDYANAGFNGARAIPQNQQRMDRECMTFSISRLGVRSVTGLLAPEVYRCW